MKYNAIHILLFLILTSCQNQKYIAKLEQYQYNQFDTVNLEVKNTVNQLSRINKIILRNRNSDTFWILNYFSIRKLRYHAIYLSKEDTILYYMDEGKIIHDTSKSHISTVTLLLIDSILLKKKRYPCSDCEMLCMAQNIQISSDSIFIKGFNLDNNEYVILRFHSKRTLPK